MIQDIGKEVNSHHRTDSFKNEYGFSIILLFGRGLKNILYSVLKQRHHQRIKLPLSMITGTFYKTYQSLSDHTIYNLYETSIYEHKNSELWLLQIPSSSIYGNATTIIQFINAPPSTTYHKFSCLIWECQYQICTSAIP
jgi:hypothetical protein